MIDSFSGTYRFLSNFWPAQVTLDGQTYRTVEHAYQAAKTADPAERELIQQAGTPGKAKRLGRQVTLRPGFLLSERYPTMEQLLRQKFSPGSELAARLLQTGDEYLVEGNRWHDNFWGRCECLKCDRRGHNYLGKLLMKIRAELWEVHDADDTDR